MGDPEQHKPKIEYYEFDASGYLEQLLHSQLEILDSDMQDDSKELALSALSIEANEDLETQGCIGARVSIHSGASILNIDEETGRPRTMTALGRVDGIYMGTLVLAEGLRVGDGEAVRRPTLIHRVEIESRSSSSAYLEQSLRRFALVNVENMGIEFMEPSSAYTPNRRLNKLLKRLDGIIENWGEYDDIYQEAVSERSTIPRQQREDWFIDHLEAALEMKGKAIYCSTDQAQIFNDRSKGKLSLYANTVDVNGMCVGFTTMPTLKPKAGEDDKYTLDTESMQLAVAVETHTSVGPVLVKVPLKACRDLLVA